jgi:endonuclease G
MAAVCLRKDIYKGIAFWADHSEKQPTNNTDAIKMFKQKIISIDDLEAKTGIDFFCNLPDDIESQVESTVDKTYWNVN